MKRSTVALCILLGLIGSPAHAELSPLRTDWSDLSRFVELAEAASSALSTAPTFDWGALPAKAGVALFDPSSTTAASGLSLFVQEGGRLLLAVESDASASLLADYGISFATAPKRAQRFQGHPALLVVSPNVRTSPLLKGVDTLISNRPRACAHRDGIEPVAVFSDHTPFAYHLKFGAGELLVLADASLFINSMLSAGDNAIFARQVARWLGREGASPIWIGGRDVVSEGRYGEATPRTFTERANNALSRIGQNSTPDRALVILLLTLILAAALVFVMGVFPGGRRESSIPWRSHHEAVAAIEGRAGQPGGPADPRPGPEQREERSP